MLTTIGSSTPVQVSSGAPLAITATALDPTCDYITLRWSIANNGSSSAVSMTMSADFSADSGNTWTVGYLAASRDKGYGSPVATDMAGVGGRVPAGSNNMVRATLAVSGTIISFAQVTQAAE